MTKNTLSKALQSPSPLLVNQTLRLITAALSRLRRVLSSAPPGAATAAPSTLTTDVRRRMPDVQVLLVVRARFDPFAPSAPPSHGIVTMSLCAVLEGYASVLEGAGMGGVAFDWGKLLPSDGGGGGRDGDGEAFGRVDPALQLRLLRTLGVVYCCLLITMVR